MKKNYLYLAAIVVMLASCKKDKKVDTTPTTTTGGTTTPATGSTLDLIRDSVFLYAKEDYYWNTQLPDYSTFNPRQYTGSDDLTALTKEVNALSQIAINPDAPATQKNKQYEYYSPNPGEAKYSFIDEGETSQRLSSVKTIAATNSGDYGFAPVYVNDNDLRVKYVYPGSPADAAGLKRGYQITAVNGSTAISSSVTSQFNFVVNAYSSNTSITLTLKKPDGTSFTTTVNAGTYKVNPILKTSVIDAGNGKKIGYIVFNSFVELSGVQSALDNAFSTFAGSGVTDLVVDLRYDGGGYVETAEYLDNLIAPASVSGQTMYYTYYNSTLTNGKAVLLKNQVRRDDNGSLYNYSQIDFSVDGNTKKFTKKGALNISNVTFIVTSATASASELTINNLRPYMNVKLLGTTTYGKPVGFFDIRINKYYMYIPEFETQNSNHQGRYYLGMTPGSTDYPGKLQIDDVTKDWGDTSEGLLKTAIDYVKNGTFGASTSTNETLARSVINSGVASANNSLDLNNFKGMLYKNPHHKN